jgi:serine protease DegS
LKGANNLSSIFKYLLKSTLFGLGLAGVLLLVFPHLRDPTAPLIPNHEPNARGLASYANAAHQATPAVVNVYTQSFSTSVGTKLKPTLASQGLGSGVIMSQQGYLLTNTHVIADADQIIVALQDGRIFYADVIGSDVITDLSVLKIDSGDPLPIIPQNDDLRTEVGDVVLAIGNPYNVGQTVTQGIISATGRIGMSSTGRQDFLQTDAAINRGNSGGALINTRGELVGINTSAFHLSDSSETYGISFAIPYQLAKRIMTGLIRDGKIVRGYLGLDGLKLTQRMARLMNLGEANGVLVQGVIPNGPAATAGLTSNDIITAINGVAIDSVKQAMDLVAEIHPGQQIKVAILRGGQSLEISVVVGELPVRN